MLNIFFSLSSLVRTIANSNYLSDLGSKPAADVLTIPEEAI